MAANVSVNPHTFLLPRMTIDQKIIPGEKANFPSHGQKTEDEISAVIAPSCALSKGDENRGKEDSVRLPIKDFSQYRDDVTQTTDESRDREEAYMKAKTKNNAASHQNIHDSRCFPLTLKVDKGQTSMNRAQQVLSVHEDSSLKPCIVGDGQDNFADDVTDGVATLQVSSSVVETERSPKQDGVKGMGISRDRKEQRSLAYRKENDDNDSFCQGEDVVADNGNANCAGEVLGACGFQKWYLQDPDILNESKDDSERGSTKKRKESLGLKGGRRDEFSYNYSSLGAPCTSESRHLGIKSGFLARHSNDNSKSCSMDETEGRFNCTNFCQFPDCVECSSRDTAPITAPTSASQSFLNFNSYQPEQSLSLPYNSKYSTKNEEILSLPPPPPPQFPGLPFDVPQERHYVSQNYFDIGAVQSRTWNSIDSDASNSSTLFGGSSNPENGTGLGGQNIGINQREIGRSAFSVHSTSTTPNLISEQAERAMRQRERERIKRETATARVPTDGDSTRTQPSLPNSNSETTSGDESLAALERSVAEACSMVERVLKEREEKEKAIKEKERRQREERTRRDTYEQESSARQARETMQRNDTGEGTSTSSEEEAPSECVALPESPQWLCEHYQRLCRVKFPCCGRFYPCHRCHNNSGECVNDHCKAKEAFYIECSVCRHQQAVRKSLRSFIVIF